ncbi:TPR-like protein [Laetiporus sulphureus 93-53]|uniref:RNA polymerase II-associated protein 3 n=1 Tax=Laetiporus sulphureus 93-53 TaxID=1314785 RepID=A0A165HIC7_9APHY|nr:TPR-like protein [Laetiporus sulphureus 93-53]KZT11767.1 TPR-like protein [Laetiporus sulphureus 93-53]
MSTTKAQAEKDKGNAAFKAGDFTTAVGHYSAAIVADSSDPTFPLNRAAAYLKLGKNQDAERDCSTVLRLDARNVKALFRRGQAKVALQKLREAQDAESNGIVTPIKPPMTLLNLTKQWDRWKSSSERWALINEIPPSALPSLFQSSLEPSLLAELLHVFRDALSSGVDPSTAVRVQEYMLGLARVPRFSTVVLFMNKEERALAREVWSLAGGAEGAEGVRAWKMS